MSIEQFNKRAIKDPNGRGGATSKEEEPGLELWAKVRQMTAREQYIYKARENSINTIIETRYHPEIKMGETYTVYIGDRKFETQVPIDKEQSGRFYEFAAREVF